MAEKKAAETTTTKMVVDALPKQETKNEDALAAFIAPAIPTEDLKVPLQVVAEDGKKYTLGPDGHAIVPDGKQPTSEKTEIQQSIPGEVGKPAKRIKMLRQDGNLELHNGVVAAKRQEVTVPKFVQEVPDSSGLKSRKGKTIKREDR